MGLETSFETETKSRDHITVCYICQSNELEGEVKHKTGKGKQGGSQKFGWRMAHPGHPLEPPLVMHLLTLPNKM